MTEQEMQKIIEGLKNDPEVGGQVRELLAERKLPTIPETKLDIDPKLVRQTKQLMALYGGGTFGEQLEAQARQGCATLTFALMVIGAIIGIGVLIAAIVMAVNHISP